MTSRIGFEICLLFSLTTGWFTTVSTAYGEEAGWSPPESLTSGPAVGELPDLFTFDNGDPVESPEDWERRRTELKAMLLYYQYGEIPRRPNRVEAVEKNQAPHPSGMGTVETVTLEIDGDETLRFRAVLYLPKHAGRRPVVIREEGNLGGRAESPIFMEKGYIFIEYARHDLDPDRDRVVGPAQAAYPNHDWETLAVWAWCGMRLIDYLESRGDVDLARIAMTGHSRGGKMALLAGALDERIRLVVPHQSGAGGAGCYRFLGPGAETLSQNDKPHWYHERIRWFGEQEERLPIDQHVLKALVAPRALLCTESLDDEFANPLGSLVTSVAAQPVFEFLGAPERNGIHFRRGGHSTTKEDWQRLLEFADWVFFDRQPGNPRDYWREAIPLTEDLRPSGLTRPLYPPQGDTSPLGDRPFEEPAPRSKAERFVRAGLRGFAADDDHHGQGRYGVVAQTFEISERQVTHVEYARFLNAIRDADSLDLYHPAMERGPGAVRRVQMASGSRYLVRNDEAPVPVVHVSWLSAVRYCNWLHHGRPNGSPGPTTTEDGVYRIGEDGAATTRSADARFFLPTENEWYKAAYLEAGDGGPRYRHFPVNNDSRPIIDSLRPDAVSPWGMLEFADSTWEWTESPVGTLHRSVRSAAWYQGNNRQAAGHFCCNPQIVHPRLGFRIARPAPSESETR